MKQLPSFCQGGFTGKLLLPLSLLPPPMMTMVVVVVVVICCWPVADWLCRALSSEAEPMTWGLSSARHLPS